MADTPTLSIAFSQHDFHQPPQATVSLSETSLENHIKTSSSTPQPFCHYDEEENQEDQKPTKKRKSWGQELPTPKTNLPPRYAAIDKVHQLPTVANDGHSKRAKTEDEKEQRRIERVLRNRAAAQSSRERKRQEVEKLEGEKATIEQQNRYLKDRIMAVEHEKFMLSQQVAKLSAQMKICKEGSSLSPPATLSPSLQPEAFDSQKIKQEIDDYPFALPTPQTFSSPSSMTYSPSQSPAQPSLGYNDDDDDDSLTTSPDMTQHPAAMLCDLQCQSGGARQALSAQPTIPLPLRKTVTPSSLANPLILLVLISTVYSQLMVPLHMIYRSLRTGSPLPTSSTTPTSPSTTGMILRLIRWLISRPTNLLPSNMASPYMIAMRTALAATTSRFFPTRRLRLLRRLVLSSPSLARPLEDATGRKLRGKTSILMGQRLEASRRSDSKVAQRLSRNAGLGSSVRPTKVGDEEMSKSAMRLRRGLGDRWRKGAICKTKRR